MIKSIEIIIIWNIIQLGILSIEKEIKIILESIMISKERIIITIIIISVYKIYKEMYKKEYKKIIESYVWISIIIIQIIDWITWYISIEILAISTYILINITEKKTQREKRYKNEKEKESKYKLLYFILSSIFSLIILYSISKIYKETGSQSMIDTTLLTNKKEIKIAIWESIIIISVLFKLGTAPLHIWVEPIYKNIEDSITFLFLFLTKLIWFSFLFFIFQIFWRYNINIPNININILTITIILSLIIGSITPIFKTNIKSILAYSSIYNVGFLLIGYLLELKNIKTSIGIYIIIYIINIYSIFTILEIYKNQILKERPQTRETTLKTWDIRETTLKTWDIRETSEESKELNHLFYIFILISILSLIGIPPLSGFYGKYYIWISFYNNFTKLLIIIFSLSIITTLLSAIYYFNVLRNMNLSRIFTTTYKENITQTSNKQKYNKYGINRSYYIITSLSTLLSLTYPLYNIYIQSLNIL